MHLDLPKITITGNTVEIEKMISCADNFTCLKAQGPNPSYTISKPWTSIQDCTRMQHIRDNSHPVMHYILYISFLLAMWTYIYSCNMSSRAGVSKLLRWKSQTSPSQQI